MFFDDDGMGYSQPLSRAFARLLGGIEKIKYFVPNLFRDTGAGITYANISPITRMAGGDANRTHLGWVVFVCVRDGVGGIHDQIQNHLIQLRLETGHKRQGVIKVSCQFGYVFPFIAGDGNCFLNFCVNVSGLLFFTARMRERWALEVSNATAIRSNAARANVSRWTVAGSRARVLSRRRRTFLP